MVGNLRSFNCFKNSPCYYQRKYLKKSIENMDAGARVLRVYGLVYVMTCYCWEGLNEGSSYVGCRLEFHYFICSRLNFQSLSVVGCRLSVNLG